MVYRKGTDAMDRIRSCSTPTALRRRHGPVLLSVRLSALDGFVYASPTSGVARNGRTGTRTSCSKQNTFNDFEDVGRAMVEMGYTSPEHLYAMGGSAGGLLMGAVMARHRSVQWCGRRRAVRGRGEHDARRDDSADHVRVGRVGQPVDEVLHYMKSYSPYDQVKARTTPTRW